MLDFSLRLRVLTDIEFEAEAESQEQSQSSLAAPQSPSSKGPRTPRKVSTHTTKLESVEDSLDPLGPLGDKSFPSIPEQEQAPTPPRKESVPSRNVRPVSSASQSSAGGGTGLMESVNLEEDASAKQKAKSPPPAQPAAPAENEGAAKRQMQPSMSVEQAAKPVFNITVGDPHKVGDLTSSHIVYQVRTKVCNSEDQKMPHCLHDVLANPFIRFRPRRRLMCALSLPSAGGIEISCGSTTLSTATTRELLSLLLRKSRLWADSSQISSSLGEPLWSGC